MLILIDFYFITTSYNLQLSELIIMTENKHIDLTLEELEQISEKDEELYIKSENTLLAYHKDFKDYENFCRNKNKDPFNLDYKFIRHLFILPSLDFRGY